MSENKLADLAEDRKTIRLFLVKHFTGLPNFIELDIGDQMSVIDAYVEYVLKGKTNAKSKNI
jgi:hypothetical protein